ncbi:MAG: RsmB/NOP family class I SAM-dependent RNA methyltransferase [Hyphomicrobiaceae bacterium]
MKTGARIAAAIEIVEDVLARHRPVALALADWAKAHRFAGSGDRAVIGNLVYDVLRRRASSAARMGSETPRALVLAVACQALGLSLDDLAQAVDGTGHAPPPLTDAEAKNLRTELSADAPDWVRANVPDWLMASLDRAFGAEAVAEGDAFAARAPLDVRANLLKATRDKVLSALEKYGAVATTLSPVGVRIPVTAGAVRMPNIEADAIHGRGWFEVQDEGSQIAALLSGAGPREQVLDLCAGAGGKTLAIGAQMSNTGQLYAYDRDRVQLRPIFERIRRAGVRNVQVLEAGDEAQLDVFGARFDCVLLDAPCSGSGTWRRKPDAKWRLSPQALATRIEEQRAVLARGASLVKPGGRLVYVTCSVLPEENIDQITTFLRDRPEFKVRPHAQAWADVSVFSAAAPVSADGRDNTLLLTPRRHGTDGFFIAVLDRRA